MPRKPAKTHKESKPSKPRYLSHKIRIYPNNHQVSYLRRACGIKRFTFNWALSESRRLYEQGVRTSGYDLCARFNEIKRDEYPWALEVSKWVPQKAIYDAFDALKRWWKKQSKAPRFKKKGKSRDTFYLGVNSFRAEGRKLTIPKLASIRMAQAVRFPGKKSSVTISTDGDRWYASFLVKLEDAWEYPNRCENQECVGIDLGVRTLAVTSDGEIVANPRWILRRERKLRRLQRAVSRKQKGSRNRTRALRLLRSCYRKVRDARRDFLHKLTSCWIRLYRYLGLEDLNVRGMMSNHRLAKHIGDASFFELRRQLEYKATLGGSTVVLVDRFYPSSKTCSSCGTVRKTLELQERVYRCEACGLEIDRDLNAALNLKSVARRHRETLNARGAEGAGSRRKAWTKPAVKKRELGCCQPEMVAV